MKKVFFISLLLLFALYGFTQSTDSEDFDAYYQAGLDFAAEDEWELAIEKMKEANALDDSRIEPFYKIGGYYLMLKAYDEAEEWLLDALKMNENEWRVTNNLGLLYTRKEEYKKALEYLSKSVASVQMKDNRAYLNRADAYMQTQQYEKAVADYEIAAQINVPYKKELMLIFSAMAQEIVKNPTGNTKECLAGNCENGKGLYLYESRNRYHGAFKNSLRHGKGTFLFTNNDYYIGDFKNDNYDGYGILFYADGDRYEGQFLDDALSGKGTMYYADGTKEVGTWENGKLVTAPQPASSSNPKIGCIRGDCKNGEGSFLFESGDKYEGEFKGELFEGKGVYHAANGTHYKGTFKEGKFYGYGILKDATGSDYQGDFKNGKFSGYGILTTSDGARFEGEFSGNAPYGIGTYYGADGSKRIGEWTGNVLRKENKQAITIKTGCLKGNCENGTGAYTYAVGNQYEGSFKAGLPDGKGTMLYANGQKYEGDFKQGSKHGRGVLTFIYNEQPARYEGEFLFGSRHGKGIETDKYGRYEGDFKEDNYHGKGKRVDTSGEMYEGEYEEGEYHGYGVCQEMNGDRYEGEFQNGKRHGKGTMYYVNGKKETGRWEDNDLIETQALAPSSIKAGWAKYEGANFTITYPGNWEESGFFKENLITFLSPFDGEKDLFRERVNLKKIALGMSKNATEFGKQALKKIKEGMREENFTFLEEKAEKVGEYDAYKISFIKRETDFGGLSWKETIYYLVKGDTVYYLTYEQTSNLHDQVAKEIIQSFRFK
ncbi:MAG: hypothetical protein ACKVTZ_19395 [Bacteroidia bacterium]